MKKTKKQRIIENIFDLICETQFLEQAKKELKKDIQRQNISYSNDKIEIQDKNGVKTLYTITIK